MVPARHVVLLPDLASYDLGASLGVPFLTAHRCLTVTEDGPQRLGPGIDPPGWYGRFLAEIARSEPSLLLTDRPAMVTLHRAARLMIAAMVAVPVSLRAERREWRLGRRGHDARRPGAPALGVRAAGSDPQASRPAGPPCSSATSSTSWRPWCRCHRHPPLVAELAATALPD